MLRSVLIASASFVVAMHGQMLLPDINEVRINTVSGWQERIENRSSASIVAMNFHISCPPRSGEPRFDYDFRFDYLVNYGHDTAIPRGAFYSLPVPQDGVDCPGGINAVLFSDGHTEGEPTALSEIVDRRVGVSEALNVVLPLLGKISESSSEPIDVAHILENQSQLVSKDQSKSVAERQGQMYVLKLVKSLLETEHDMFVPSDLARVKQPGISETMRNLRIPRKQAHAVVLKRKLDEWNIALQGQLKPA